MHEMSIAQSLFDMVTQELANHGLTTLKTVTVRHGRLANVVPEALEFAWQAVTIGTPLEGSVCLTEEAPLVLRCRACAKEFEPQDAQLILAACPACGEELGHQVVSGRELHLQRLEAE